MEEFLKWCFANFTVGIWSCGKRDTIEMEVFQSYADSLAFVRSQDDSTSLWPRRSQVSEEKPLFLKELSKLWSEDVRFSEFNTILLDNHSEKFERNPPGNCVLVPDFLNDVDDVLRLDGELVKHLKAMMACVNLKEYAQANIESSYFSFINDPPPISPAPSPGLKSSITTTPLISTIANVNKAKPPPLDGDLAMKRRAVVLFTSSQWMRTNSAERDVEFYMRYHETPGPRAMPLRRKDLSTLRDWVVCEKTDGSRALLFIPEDEGKTQGYFFDRAWNMSIGEFDSSSTLMSHKTQGGTLLDGEFATSSHNKLKVFFVFDVIFLHGRDAGSIKTLEERMGALTSAMGESPQYSFIHQGQTVFLVPKRFLPLNRVQEIDTSKISVPECLNAPKDFFPCDGLVFTPSQNRTYFEAAVFKFKPAHKITIDFVLSGSLPDPKHILPDTLVPLNLSMRSAGVAGGGYRASTPIWSEVPVAEMIVDQETLALLGDAPLQRGPRIVECRFVPDRGAWKLLAVRRDKSKSNSLQVAWKVLESVAEALTLDEVRKACVDVFHQPPVVLAIAAVSVMKVPPPTIAAKVPPPTVASKLFPPTITLKLPPPTVAAKLPGAAGVAIATAKAQPNVAGAAVPLQRSVYGVASAAAKPQPNVAGAVVPLQSNVPGMAGVVATSQPNVSGVAGASAPQCPQPPSLRLANPTISVAAHYDNRQLHRDAVSREDLDDRIVMLRNINNAVKYELIKTSFLNRAPVPTDFTLFQAFSLPNVLKSNQAFFKPDFQEKPNAAPLKILDLGCGRGGDLMKWFNRHNVDTYVGVDISSASLEEAKQRIEGSRKKPRVAKFVLADCGAPKFALEILKVIGEGETFDYISIQFALHYFCATRDACTSFFKAVKSFCVAGKTKILITILDDRVVCPRLIYNRDEWSNSICRVRRLGPLGGDSFSQLIEFSLGDAVVGLPEPLLSLDNVSAVTVELGFRILRIENFSSILSRVCETKAREELPFKSALSKTMGESKRGVSFDEWSVAEMYCIFVLDVV